MKIKTTFNSIEEMREWAALIVAADAQKVSTVEPEIKIAVDATGKEEEQTPVETLKDVQKRAVDKAEKAAAEKAAAEKADNEAKAAAEKAAAEKVAVDKAAAEKAAAEKAAAEKAAAEKEVPALTYDEVINRIKNMKINGYPKIVADVAAWKTAGSYPSLKEMSAEQLQLVVEFLDTKEV
jgi:membrane protein involved in colicin uptake